MAALPTRIRQTIRDTFTSPTCPLTLATTSLTTTLGYPISISPEWAMLWTTLQPYYPDPSTFAPTIASILITWCEALTTWLERDDNEEDVETLLEGLKGVGRVVVVLEVDEKGDRPKTSWRGDRSVFVLALPTAEPLPRNTVLAGFVTDLRCLFTASAKVAAIGSVHVPKPALDDPEDWASLDMVETQSASVYSRPNLVVQERGEDTMPEIATLLRPEELMKRVPYFLVVRQCGASKVVIQGSHAPSLVCLNEYLKRWCRGEAARINRPPVVEIQLQESAFGLGLLNDTLTLDAIRGREVSAMLVLVFVESVLGYTHMNPTNSGGAVWEFKRTKAFK